MVRLAYFMLYVILRTTIWYSKEALTMPLRAASALNMILLFVEYYCLWKGLQDTQLKQDAEAIPGSGTIVGLMLWTILMAFWEAPDTKACSCPWSCSSPTSFFFETGIVSS